MASFDLPEIPQPRVSPALLVGAASPLWSFFGAAAAGGVAYWWMTRWARPVNLEAMFGAAKTLAIPEPLLQPVLEPVVAAAEAVAETVVQTQAALTAAVTDEAPAPVGGEAAPIGPVPDAKSALESVNAPEPDAMFAAPPEPVIDEPAPVAEVTVEETPPRPRAKKVTPPAPETDA